MSRNKNPEQTVERIVSTAAKLFMEKGYEHTTIQDIVNQMKDLSKGVIYHHFSSKDDIVEAVVNWMHRDVDFRTMFDDTAGLTGREKITKMLLYCITNTDQQRWMKSAPTIMMNPKFLALTVRHSVEEYAPILVPYIEEGNRDGSLHVEYPVEAAEVMLLLANTWINPLVFKADTEKFNQKLLNYKKVLDGMGLVVLDTEVLQSIMHMKKAVE